MPLEDSNPTRRNLVVASLAFILYCWGGGSFKDSTVHLSVINVEFEHQVFLGIMAWVILFWCMYRYRLEFAKRPSQSFRLDIFQPKDTPFTRSYAEKMIGGPFPPIPQGETRELRVQNIEEKWVLVVTNNRAANNSTHPMFLKFTEKPSDHAHIPLRGVHGVLVFLCAAAIASYERSGFSDYIVPVVLFYLAVAGGVVRLVQAGIHWYLQ